MIPDLIPQSVEAVPPPLPVPVEAPAVVEQAPHAVADAKGVAGGELAGKTFGTVESVKAVSDLYAPASGTVTEVNDTLATSPENVNKDAHGSWMLKLTLKDSKQLDGLLSSADYEKFVAEEGGH